MYQCEYCGSEYTTALAAIYCGCNDENYSDGCND